MQIGDRVTVKPGRSHGTMTQGKTGTVALVAPRALGIRFDGIGGKIHKWYVPGELVLSRRKAEGSKPVSAAGSGYGN